MQILAPDIAWNFPPNFLAKFPGVWQEIECLCEDRQVTRQDPFKVTPNQNQISFPVASVIVNL